MNPFQNRYDLYIDHCYKKAISLDVLKELLNNQEHFKEWAEQEYVKEVIKINSEVDFTPDSSPSLVDNYNDYSRGAERG